MTAAAAPRRAPAPLPPALLADLEARFAADLGAVRLHGGALARWLCRRLGAAAVTFGRRVLCSAAAWERLQRGDPRALALAAHECVHVLQYRRDGFFTLLRRYLGEYLAGRRRGLSHDAAYRAISYEREAFAVEAAVAGSAAPAGGRR